MKKTKLPPAFKVTQRQIRVGTVEKLIEYPDVVLFSIDLVSKHAEIFSTGADEGVPLVMLAANTRTMRWNRRYKYPTEIQFPYYEGWHIHSVNVSRYTLSVALYR